MDVSRSIFVEWHRFEQDIVDSDSLLLHINQFEEFIAVFEYVRVALLTDLTFKFLPVVTGHVLSVLLHVFLRGDPTFQTLEVDQSYRPTALARQNQRIFRFLVSAPTKSTLYCVSRTMNTKIQR